MLHEVMQACLRENRWESSWIDDKIKQVILKRLNNCINIDVTIKQAKREVTTRAKGLRAFPEKCISQWPKPRRYWIQYAVDQQARGSLLAFSDLLDIEEDIWWASRASLTRP
ncbi:hypothetical protein H0H87_005818 [Tephrocybe sp. NHM501043]|nr:hypothetical protein H0H87_005818 [Tephrocybe sp. NHM501043]